VELARRTLIVAGTVTTVVIVLVLAWQAYDVLLLVFGAAALAVFLRTLADWVAARTHSGPTWSLALALLGLIALLGAGAYVLAGRLADQTQELSTRLPIAIADLEGRLARYAWGRGLLQTAGRWLSATNATTVISAAERALVAGGRAGADVVVALFLGLLVAANPRLYVGGLVRLFPREMRDAAHATLADIGSALRSWMLAQVTLMIAFGAAASLGLWLIGMPIALALGVLTGFLVFVPYLGTLGAYAITLVIALAISPRIALEATAVYVGVHLLEGYVLAPLLHWNVVLLPPALTIFAQALLLSIVGLPGVFLATPLVASLRVLVLDVYVRRVLERDTPLGLGGTRDAERFRVSDIGCTRWAIAEGYIPGRSHGPEPAMTSHETVCMLNAGERDAHVEITVFLTDRDPIGPYRVTVPARRTRHLRFNDLCDPAPIPRETDYASIIESDVPIVVQHTRLDSRRAENALHHHRRLPRRGVRGDMTWHTRRPTS
jgi:predicted PurR-regulated permease PerM